MPTVDENNAGNYTEPFTLTQYGVFSISSKDGKPRFRAASVASEQDALLAATIYDQDNVDESEINTFFVRTRTVTYGLWDS